MHNILSNIVLRGYHYYSNQEANLFKRAGSKSREKKTKTQQSTIQTRQKPFILPYTDKQVFTSDFEIGHNVQLKQLSKAIDKVEKAIQQVKSTLNYDEKKTQIRKQNEIKQTHKQSQHAQTSINKNNNIGIKREIIEGKGFLKQFKQKMTHKKTNPLQNNQFNLFDFKNKLNYKMVSRA